jgi:hypothetical protein
MAYYAYKEVRDILPQWLIDSQGASYQGEADYDGDQWIAAAEYIIYLQWVIQSLDPNHNFDTKYEISKTSS